MCVFLIKTAIIYTRETTLARIFLSELMKKCYASYGTQKFITVFALYCLEQGECSPDHHNTSVSGVF
jgi:hypothetical protein